MTFIEFKKVLLDLETTIPKFANLIKVNEKNIQAYKKKGEVPNTIAVIVTLMADMKEHNLDVKSLVEELELNVKTKSKSKSESESKKRKDI